MTEGVHLFECPALFEHWSSEWQNCEDSWAQQLNGTFNAVHLQQQNLTNLLIDKSTQNNEVKTAHPFCCLSWERLKQGVGARSGHCLEDQKLVCSYQSFTINTDRSDGHWAEELLIAKKSTKPSLHPSCLLALRNSPMPLCKKSHIRTIIQDTNPWLIPNAGGVSVTFKEAAPLLGHMSAVIWAPKKESCGGVSKWAEQLCAELTSTEMNSVFLIVCGVEVWRIAREFLGQNTIVSTRSPIHTWKFVKDSPFRGPTEIMWVACVKSRAVTVSSTPKWEEWVKEAVSRLNLGAHRRCGDR